MAGNEAGRFSFAQVREACILAVSVRAIAVRAIGPESGLPR